MRVRSLMLVAVGAALIAPAALHGAAPPEAAHERPASGPDAGPRDAPDADAADLPGQVDLSRTEAVPVTRHGRAPGNTLTVSSGLGPRHTPLTRPGRKPGTVPGPWRGRDPRNAPDARRGQAAGAVRAADLLAAVRDCAPVSRAPFRSDVGKPADIDVCGRRNAVYWKADLDVDCDGRPGRWCNAQTDPLFHDTTAYQQSDGRQLSAERLPYVVVPAPSHRWNHREHGVRRGTVAAVVHRDRVRYAVVGDVGPEDIIGEASYALARDLGVHPDPRGGGTASGVTYILFKGSAAAPVESRRAAAAQGERLARAFVGRG
ncbi:glycoside hydrolase family 75 protein [Streptomyces beigongshangae]|uniref:glycoside hydrolase family 75 protein n=1 Tax=Streptomyces beigongshangae TaxID=2841597 RepID=UPI0027E083B3|nr:glycoside hydrolase family 75 protein [Streptomyces sp. REN17]